MGFIIILFFLTSRVPYHIILFLQDLFSPDHVEPNNEACHGNKSS